MSRSERDTQHHNVAQAAIPGRVPLNRDRVLRAAVVLADEVGIDSLSMRSLAQRLGVAPMALYKHVASKEELLDGMVSVVVAEIDPPMPGLDWKRAVRERVLSARHALLRHPWAPHVIESRTQAPLVVLDYMNSLIGTFLAGGLSADLTHHVMHALGSRMWGFTQEVFPTPQPPAERFPHIIEIASVGEHDDKSAVGRGCDDQFEFEFALDVLLDGFERLHNQGWTSTNPVRTASP